LGQGLVGIRVTPKSFMLKFVGLAIIHALLPEGSGSIRSNKDAPQGAFLFGAV
jgi:hypothetical protein